MRVVLKPTRQSAEAYVASIVLAVLTEPSGCRLGVATGATYDPVYELVSRRAVNGRFDPSRNRIYLLDEYIGLAPDHPERFTNVIKRVWCEQIGLRTDQVVAPDVDAPDLHNAAQRYDRLIVREGIGLQLLGIGRNGHIGFNEPGSSLTSRTRVVRLSAQTRLDNSPRFVDQETPTHAVTQGIGTILEAQRLILLATGRDKAEPIRELLTGPITKEFPASALRSHSDATVIFDADAARLMEATHIQT